MLRKEQACLPGEFLGSLAFPPLPSPPPPPPQFPPPLSVLGHDLRPTKGGKERMLGGVQEIAFLSPYPAAAAAAAGLISPGPNSTILPPQALFWGEERGGGRRRYPNEGHVVTKKKTRGGNAK